MAAAEMNFRAHYYDKVGFRGINENRSLEILLSEKPIDLKKLSNFCRKFCLPSVHRLTVWKVLLGILPTFEENITSFEKDEEDQYNDLRRALEVMRVVRNGTPQADTIALMYLVGEGRLHLDIEQQMSDEEVQHIRSIASVFTKICGKEEEAYWLTRNFWKHLKKLAVDSDAMGKQVEDTLEKEDHELFQQLLKIKAFPVLPLETWFQRCFAEVLDEDALVRIWDKVIGGSTKILPDVAALLLMSLRAALLSATVTADVLTLLSKISKEASEAVVNRALE
ncbi:TBC1 domain family member 7 [Dermacentor andersoni]|uniref:TBC1 domain family member 7 n=1 Tax=Dermacentor andersoni TaxID=34620 RepID=UPI0021553056|nr:TBC1 domain family member 7-like [Dermacentor andersoni]